MLRQIGRYEEAVGCFRDAIRCQPDFADAYQNLGAILMLKGQFALAQSCCEKVLTLQPDSLPALANLGYNLEAQGKHRKALGAYDQALNLEPDAPSLLYQKEHLLLTLCDWQDYEQRMATLQEMKLPTISNKVVTSLLIFPIFPLKLRPAAFMKIVFKF